MVKRYEPDELEIIGMRRDDDGDYVDYADYAALEQRVRELAAEIAEPSIKELDVLCRIRKAIGDNGKMMQDELVSHIEGLVGRVKELNELGRLLKEAKTKIAELEAALDLANKRLKSKADPLSQALNEGDGVYRP